MRNADPDRRRFLGVFAATAVTSISLPFIIRGTRPAMAADAPLPRGGNVTLDEYGANKKLIDTRSLPRVVMTEAQWKEKLDARSYYVTREAGTEAPYSAKGYDSHANGLYRWHLLRHRALRLGHEVRFRHGLAEFWQPLVEAQHRGRRTDTEPDGKERIAVSCRALRLHTWGTCSTMVPTRPDCATA